jgi:acetoin utilization protein AcuB
MGTMSQVHETVRDAMHQGVISCEPELPLREAVRLMTQAGVRALVVMASSCELAGIVSQTDVVNATLEPGQAGQWEELTVRDVMTPNVLTVTPDTPLSEAAKVMVDGGLHRLVVVESQPNACIPVGVLSLGDIMRRLSKE